MPAPEANFVVGIDLGTSNCAVAFADPRGGPGAATRDFPVAQLTRVGGVETLPTLPSILWMPTAEELAAGGLTLPWGGDPSRVAGEAARVLGARVAGRQVTSAKSWLCHGGMDRRAEILPRGAPEGCPRISPVEASALFLGHLAAAWGHAHPEAPLGRQEIVLTVPASFDEVARGLTVEAARRAGFEHLALLEEPQAAFYDFVSAHRGNLAEALGGARLVLVVDVGGGTSDFTLIQVAPGAEAPELRRVAVGDHLMLGGDNMDHAIARRVEEGWRAAGKRPTAGQWLQLLRECRAAKERLLGAEAPESARIAVASAGSQLLGGALGAVVARAEAEQWILDGFLPRCGPEAAPQASGGGGIQEVGLPFARDPAITRHLAAFLRARAAEGFAALGGGADGGLPRPDAILLNGGVFNSPALARRLVEAVSAWWPGRGEIPLLPHGSLDLSVARGAAFHGLARRGLARRIGGGTPRGLYVGLGAGKGGEAAALCLVPKGSAEGVVVELKERPFQLMVGQPVRFELFSAACDLGHPAGAVAPASPELHPLAPIHALMRSGKKRLGKIPVHLRAHLTEVGTLELWCVAAEGDEEWRLEFEVRGRAGGETLAVTDALPPRFAEARAWVESVYGARPAPSAEAGWGDPRRLWENLERLLGPRAEWPMAALRELAGLLLAGIARRRRSAAHEKVFLQLAGWCLRPGFGFPLDDWRCGKLAECFAEGVEFHKEKPIWNEFWILWRRVAGGLDDAAQAAMWDFCKPWLLQAGAPAANTPRKGKIPEGLEEMVRAAAALERLPAGEKELLGGWICGVIAKREPTGGPWAWALGRLGARVPTHGSLHAVVEPGVAAGWAEFLLRHGPEKLEGAPLALALIARPTGDRLRDLEESIRHRAIEALTPLPGAAACVQLLSEIRPLESREEARILGDTLPPGLHLS